MTISEKSPILAWHFLKEGWLTDERSLHVKVDETLTESLPLTICEHGLHASRELGDALSYSPGPILTLCECWGEVHEQDDKLVCQYRRPIWGTDITAQLHEFACACAEVALLIAEVDDERSWNAIEAKRAWLRGEISNDELDAAWDAARAAARAAALDVAWDAARAAARAAARDAALAAAWAAAWDAARDRLLSDVTDLMPANIKERLQP